MKPVKPVVVAGIAVVFGIAGFFGGMYYQQSQRQTFRMGTFSPGGNFQGQAGQPNRGQNAGFGNRGSGMGRVMGEILKLDDQSMTVAMQDGSSKIVLLSPETTYTESSKASKDAVKVGVTVSVFGNTNTDGSVMAQDVQLNPQIPSMQQGNPNQK